MIPILTPQQMIDADNFAINRMKVPSLHLMERAGIAVTMEILNRVRRIRKKSVIVLCGKGNNGGDGFVVARLLREYGVDVVAVLVGNAAELKGDAAVNYKRMQIKNILSYSELKKKKNVFPDIIVDAMFGTLFKGSLSGKYLDAVRWCNAQRGWKVAVDIPSGLNGETGEVGSDAFRADITVTLSNPKLGLYVDNAKEFTGEVVVATIGLPVAAFKKSPGNIFLTEEIDIKNLIPLRPVNSHKHSIGKIFILAGAKGMTGAALLCSSSAMRSGAGQVILGIPESEYSIVAKRTLEAMPVGLASTQDGSLSLNASEHIKERIRWSDVVVLGCGISRNEETLELVRTLIRQTTKPMVIDADGIYALKGHLSLLKKSKSKNIIITPHFGEFSGLVDKPTQEIEQSKFKIARDFSKKYGITLVLKGAPTLIATPSGDIFVNPTGNPGMSTAGSGDVLSGIIGALMGQHCSMEAAAVTGVYLHGLAGDSASQKKGMHSMIASDMIRCLPGAFKSIIV